MKGEGRRGGCTKRPCTIVPYCNNTVHYRHYRQCNKTLRLLLLKNIVEDLTPRVLHALLVSALSSVLPVIQIMSCWTGVRHSTTGLASWLRFTWSHQGSLRSPLLYPFGIDHGFGLEKCDLLWCRESEGDSQVSLPVSGQLRALRSWTTNIQCQERQITSGSPVLKNWPQGSSIFSWRTTLCPAKDSNFFTVLYSTLLLPPLRFLYVWEYWDRTQDCCNFDMGINTF